MTCLIILIFLFWLSHTSCFCHKHLNTQIGLTLRTSPEPTHCFLLFVWSELQNAAASGHDWTFILFYFIYEVSFSQQNKCGRTNVWKCWKFTFCKKIKIKINQENSDKFFFHFGWQIKKEIFYCLFVKQIKKKLIFFFHGKILKMY